jgi:hypothetical protein
MPLRKSNFGKVKQKEMHLQLLYYIFANVIMDCPLGGFVTVNFGSDLDFFLSDVFRLQMHRV